MAYVALEGGTGPGGDFRTGDAWKPTHATRTRGNFAVPSACEPPRPGSKLLGSGPVSER